MVVLFGLAEWLETRAAGRARDAIAAVLALNPETAVLAASGKCRGHMLCEVPSLACDQDVQAVYGPPQAAAARFAQQPGVHA